MFCSFHSRWWLAVRALMAAELRNVVTLRSRYVRIRGHRPRYARPPRIPTVCHGHPCNPFPFALSQASLDSFILENLCGERGIRTPETLLEFTRFPGVPLQPLEHLSFVGMRLSH